MLDAARRRPAQMEVVLAPGDSGILLHEAVGHGLEADFNRKGTSNYSGQIGKRVASELCTVVDDATLTHSPRHHQRRRRGQRAAARTCSSRTACCVGYMHDRSRPSTSSSRPPATAGARASRARPLPRMTNTILLAGPHDPEEILRSVKRGVYAKRFGGGQVDISNGDFVFSLTESYLIEDGKLTAPLKGVNLIGNGPDVLAR